MTQNQSIRSWALIALVALVALLSAACAAPNVMVTNTMGQDRTVQYVVQKSLDGDEEDLYNLYIRVCPLDAQGHQDESQCKKSLALQNVVVRD